MVAKGSPREPLVITKDLHGGRFEAPQGSDLHLREISAVGVEFSALRHVDLTCEGSTFEGCRFDGLNIEHGDLATPPIGIYRDCTFNQTRLLRSLRPGHARFERCSFQEAHIEGWFTWCAQFIDCRFTEAEIVGCKFSARPKKDCFGLFDFRNRRRVNEFRGNDFRHAKLIDTSFVGGVDLDEQFLPDAPEYVRINDARASLERARSEFSSWTNEDEKRYLMAALEALAFGTEEQRDLFVQRDFLDLPAKLRDEVWEVVSQAAR